MWGIIPAAGSGTRIQPLAFSKELLPVGGRIDGAVERPRAISEYLVDRMIVGGASKLCFVISPGKSDILEYYGGGQLDSVTISFVVQPQASGLCDAIFQAAPLIAPTEPVRVDYATRSFKLRRSSLQQSLYASDCLTRFGFPKMRFARCRTIDCPSCFSRSISRSFSMLCVQQAMAMSWKFR